MIGALRQRGMTLISVLIGIMMATGLFYVLGLVYGQNEHTLDANRKKIYAEQYASELLEYFRSLTTDNIRDLMSQNPISPAAPAYPLCAHINILDRSSGSILNPDPRADLPPSALIESNRFYMVYIVDSRTMAVKSTACNNVVGTYTFQPEDRFFITVGVSWRANMEETTGPIHRVVLSTLIP